MQFSHHIQAKNKTPHKSTMGAYRGSKDCFGFHKATLLQPIRIQKEMKEGRGKGL